MGIQTLIDQIRSSQAWQQLAATSNPSPPSSNERMSTNTTKTGSSGSSVASLLSQLRPACQIPESSTSSGVNNEKEHALQLNLSASNSPMFRCDTVIVPMKDPPSLDLGESMPIFSQLSRNSAFVEEVKKVTEFIRSDCLPDCFYRWSRIRMPLNGSYGKNGDQFTESTKRNSKRQKSSMYLYLHYIKWLA